MAYLQLSSGVQGVQDHSKAVISFWFRIPQSTFDFMSGVDGSSLLLGKVIPLITFGSNEVDSSSAPVPPCYIGVDCIFDGLQSLTCSLQTPVRGTFTSSFTPDQTPQIPSGRYYFQGWTFGPGHTGNLFCAADKWHHALISFSIGDDEAINWNTSYPGAGPSTPMMTSGNSFSWALDDRDRTNSPNNVNPSGGANWLSYGLSSGQAVSNWLWDVGGFPGETTPSAIPPDTATFGPGAYIQSSNNYVGIPASSNLADSLVNVKMAELQFYTGAYLDTSVTANRRLFVSDTGKPVSWTTAAAVLGNPKVLFASKSSNWIGGKNGGVAGKFDKIGTIVNYTPGPGL